MLLRMDLDTFFFNEIPPKKLEIEKMLFLLHFKRSKVDDVSLSSHVHST